MAGGRTIPTCRFVAAALLLAVAATPAAASTPDLLPFLQARAADADGAVDFAASRYAAALAAAPADPVVALPAYREAIEAGDLALADRAAAVLLAANAAPPDAAVLALAAAAHDRQPGAADLAIARLERGPLALLAPPLKAWAALDRGGDALAPLAQPRGDAVARRLAEETRGLILIAQGKAVEGIAALRATLGTDVAADDLRVAAARLLIGAGKRDAAKALLVGDDPAIAALRDDPRDGIKPSLAFGASVLFARIASDLAAGQPGPLPIVMARAALRADPSNDRARLLLAETLARSGAVDRALVELDAIAPKSPYAAEAASLRVETLAADGRADQALATARQLADGRDADPVALQRYADLLMTSQRPAEAAPLYRKLLDRRGKDAEWSTWLQYGASLDEAGDWKRARPALERAVALAPDQPLALNYLGYASIVHGEDPAAAQAMLEKASRLKPQDAAITDSLGWAYHLAGQTPRALPLLERAAAESPDSDEINEHLGDVYWTLGRRYEARYAWRAAQLAAAPADVTRLAGKIADGLPAR